MCLHQGHAQAQMRKRLRNTMIFMTTYLTLYSHVLQACITEFQPKMSHFLTQKADLISFLYYLSSITEQLLRKWSQHKVHFCL